MTIIDRYLWKSTLQGLSIAWFALVLLDLFFSFIDELGKTNDVYSTPQVIVYLVYTLPSRFYEFFPPSMLIGALLGLGNLSANSEFVAMRAAGISIKQIVFSVLKLGLLLAVTIFIIGEWVVPTADLQARNFKIHLKNKNIILIGGAGLWIKNSNSVTHVSKVTSSKKISGISIYTFNNNHTGLKSLTTSSDATLIDKDWKLKNIVDKQFFPLEVRTSKKNHMLIKDFINAEILTTAAINPNQLSSSSLDKIIQHKKENNLKTGKYELIYWKRYATPLSSLVMLILAMPFLFGLARGGGTGQRVFIGIVIGIAFFLTNRLANELGVVNSFSPFLSAFLPSAIFFSVGFFALNKIR